jgi:hypothetical protein
MVGAMAPDLGERLVPTPRGFDDEVKGKAARAERGWEAATGLFGALGATGTAALAAGVAIPPLAPFFGLVAASSFYFKLRAKWAKEDPPRADFDVSVDWQPPRLDLTPVLSVGGIRPGAACPRCFLRRGQASKPPSCAWSVRWGQERPSRTKPTMQSAQRS